jgi:hypothetical protein
MLPKTLKLPSVVMLAAAALVWITSCEKKEDAAPVAPSTLQLYLTDDPADYKAVWIDIQKVSVLLSDTAEHDNWQDVPLLNPGRYNILDFRNGDDTLLVSADVPPGRLSAIRLTLGDQNTLILNDGHTFPLLVPSGVQPKLTLEVENASLEAGTPYALVLDFDAARSISEPARADSGEYTLNPVIHIFAKGAGASIEGWVYPASAKAHVLAISTSNDTLAAIPDDLTGFYKFWGIPEGTYNILFRPEPSTGYQNDIREGIQATTDQVVQIDTVRLHQ